VSGSHNISGLWMGQYAYSFGGAVPFLAKIEDRGGRLAGTIIEPNTVGESSDSLEAILSGSRDGSAIDFTKIYDGASDAAHAVDYVGHLSGDGNSITGMWSLADMDGSFEMYREAVWDEAEEQEARVVRVE
jgi:hypothetical protein